MTATEDTILLNAIKIGDEQAFKTLFSKFWKKIYAIAYHRLGDEQDADDLVQELFISIWERREEIILKGSFEQYLVGAVKFKVISTIRNRSVKEKVFDELKKRMTEIEHTLQDRVDYKDLDKTFNSTLLSMHENVRMAFLLRIDNMTIKDIAEQLGLQEQTVRNHIANALQRIRTAIKEKYGDEPILYSSILLACIHDYLG